MLQTVISQETIAYLTEVLQVGSKHMVGSLQAVVEVQRTWQAELGAHMGTLTEISTGSSWQENNKMQAELPKASFSLFSFFFFSPLLHAGFSVLPQEF